MKTLIKYTLTQLCYRFDLPFLIALVLYSRYCFAIISMSQSYEETTGNAGMSQQKRLRNLTPKPRMLDRHSRLMNRVYGAENEHVRRNLKIISNASHRSQTGLVDPKRFDLVKYENHPMQDWADNHRRLVEKHGGDLAKAHEEGSAQRKLQSKTRSLQDSSWAPMRIYYETTALWDQDDGTNTIKLQFVEDTVLPKAAAFWSKTLSVVPVGGNIMINPDDLASSMYCGDSEFSLVPSSHMSTGVPDTDLVLYVSATPSTRFCGPSTLAVAVACNFDGYDRPVAGAVNICLDQVRKFVI